MKYVSYTVKGNKSLGVLINDNIVETTTGDWFPWFYHDYVATQKEKSGDE